MLVQHGPSQSTGTHGKCWRNYWEMNYLFSRTFCRLHTRWIRPFYFPKIYSKKCLKKNLFFQKILLAFVWKPGQHSVQSRLRRCAQLKVKQRGWVPSRTGLFPDWALSFKDNPMQCSQRPWSTLCMLEWGVRVLFRTNVSWRLLSSIVFNFWDR